MNHFSDILLVLAPIAVFALIVWVLLFKRGSRGHVPSPKKVREQVPHLSTTSKETIAILKGQYESQLSDEAFSTLCLATALSIEQPLSELGNNVTLAEYLDSLSHVEFIILMEALFDIEISDADASTILTFRSLSTYVESAIVNS